MESRNPTQQRRILGIEGGGTKTEWVLLGDDGTVLGEGKLHSANLKLLSDAELTNLFAVMPRDVTHVGAFLAGCALDSDRARLHALASASWPHAEIRVGSDRESGFATALGDDDGLVVISGTGAVVHGRCGGRMDKAGGWGHILGDRGGGYDIARHALRTVIRRWDLDHTPTELASAILGYLGLNDLPNLDDWVIHADKTSIAALAPVVFRAAEHDEEIRRFIEHRARELADFARSVARRLGLESGRVEVRMLGGLLTHDAWYADTFTRYLHERLPEANVEPCTRSGAYGAARLAAGGELPPPKAHGLPDEQRAELSAAATEQRHERAAELSGMNARELVELFVAEESHVQAALNACAEPIARAVAYIHASLGNDGRLFYVGAGTSGRLGVLDASEIPPTFGTEPELVQGIIAGGSPALVRAIEGAEDSPEAGAMAVNARAVRAGDVVCGITASGRTPFVLGALGSARVAGAKTVLISCNPARYASAQPWDVEIDLPTGPEIVAGSTRLKAGTATKVTLNILTTCAMILLGRVRGGAMLDVRATNAKLRDRAIRIVSIALEVDADAARARLEAAQWNVRAALDATPDTRR